MKSIGHLGLDGNNLVIEEDGKVKVMKDAEYKEYMKNKKLRTSNE